MAELQTTAVGAGVIWHTNNLPSNIRSRPPSGGFAGLDCFGLAADTYAPLQYSLPSAQLMMPLPPAAKLADTPRAPAPHPLPPPGLFIWAVAGCPEQRVPLHTLNEI
jgi:hypothetical protein